MPATACWGRSCAACGVSRVFVNAAAGRQRLNVWGTWNAVTHELVSVLNTATVNADTMCELLRKSAVLGLAGPITRVLDNAKDQLAAAVKALAQELGIHREFLLGDSPNLNLIGRLWKFLKCRALYGRYHPDFTRCRTAIETEITQLSTTHNSAIDLLSMKAAWSARCSSHFFGAVPGSRASDDTPAPADASGLEPESVAAPSRSTP